MRGHARKRCLRCGGRHLNASEVSAHWFCDDCGWRLSQYQWVEQGRKECSHLIPREICPL